MKHTLELLCLLVISTAVSCSTGPSGPYSFEDVPFSVIPHPSSVSLSEGYFELTAAPFLVDAALGEDGLSVARDLACRLQKATGYKNRVKGPR